VTPSFFVTQNTFSIKITGSGFSSDPALKVECNGNNLNFSPITSDLEISNVMIPSAVVATASGVYNIRISTNTESRSKIVYGIDPPSYSQLNDVVTATTTKGFSNIPMNEIAFGTATVNQIPTFINDKTVQFNLVLPMVQNQVVTILNLNYFGNFNVYQSAFMWAPAVFGATFYSDSLELDGYFSSYTKVTVGDTPCTFTSVNNQGYWCELPASFFQDGLNALQIKATTEVPSVPPSLPTSLTVSQIVLSYLQYLPSGAISIALQNSFGNDNVLYGVAATGYIPLDSIDTTTATFTPPLTITCNYGYLGSGSLAGSRRSNSILICPKPKLLSITPKPDPVLGGTVKVRGNFISTSMLNGNKNTVFKITPYAGTSYICSQPSIINDADQIYTVECPIPPGKGAFTLFAESMTGASDSIDFSYSINIDTVSSLPRGSSTQIITITGNGFTNTNLQVLIGNQECSSPLASTDGTSITCSFQANIVPPNGSSSLPVHIINNGAEAYGTFSYVCSVLCSVHGKCNTMENICECDKGWGSPDCSTVSPSIKSVSSIKYGVPGQVTIVGTNFVDLNLFVSIGGLQCTNPIVSQDLTTITCLFQSNVPEPSNGGLLDVYISIDSRFITSGLLFTYKGTCKKDKYGQECSLNGVCNDDTLVCQCNKGWDESDCSVVNPVIKSSTSTKYGTPAQITIVGNNFVNLNLFISIGASHCTNPTVSQDLSTIICLYQSNITVNNINDALDVFVSINSTFTTTNKVFLYTKPDKKCPTNTNGQICSGHGTCNQQFTCDCDKGWETSDCSIPNTGNNGGGVIETPTVNENDTSTTIITPSGTKFDIGISMINELDNNNNLIQSFFISAIKWLNITKEDNVYQYTTTLDNNSTLIVKLTINDKDERVYYNFAGDIIPILPKSIKYQIELHNWTFSNSLNFVEFIFKSGITESNECKDKEQETSTQSNADSVRNIQMTLNGETLIGTFSDRMILDGRPTYNKVNKLTNDQIKSYQLDTTPLYTSIQTSSFKNNVIVDPNFGVLVSSTPDKCTNGMQNWKIAVIVVCSVVGAAIIVTAVWMLFKKNSTMKVIGHKLKRLNKR